jgi:hypothetical protein
VIAENPVAVELAIALLDRLVSARPRRQWRSALLSSGPCGREAAFLPGPSVAESLELARASSSRPILTPSLRSCSKRGEELRQRHAKCSGKLAECRDPDFPLSALDATDVISMQICACGQLLLRDLELPAQFAHPAPNGHR